jgi:hypothetical protein
VANAAIPTVPGMVQVASIEEATTVVMGIEVPTVQHPTLRAALSQEIKCAHKVLKAMTAPEGHSRLESLHWAGLGVKLHVARVG